MRRRTFLATVPAILTPFLTPHAHGADDKKTTPTRSILRNDPAFDALLDKDAKIEELAGGFAWSEGPVWDKKANALLFCDIPNNRINRWSEKDGLKEFLKPSGYTGGDKFTGREPG
jgi:gluconolactonase